MGYFLISLNRITKYTTKHKEHNVVSFVKSLCSSCSLSFILLLTVSACNSSVKDDKSATAKKEIMETEKEFEAVVKKDGMTKGFTEFADENAVMKHGDSLVKGRSGIQNYYQSRKLDNNQLEWTADFVDAAASGEMGYTYGHYTYTVKDSTGKPSIYTGFFHTVWKKQKDGKWRFVWD